MLSSPTHCDDLDLKKLFEESIPDSPFAAVVYKYADAMLEHGRDTYGPQRTGLFLSAFDRRTLKPLEGRPDAPAGLSEALRPGTPGKPLVGASPAMDQNLLRLLYFLKDLSTQDRYAQAADAELKWLLHAAAAPDSNTAPWDAGENWNVMQDEFTPATEHQPHELFGPWMLYDRGFDLAPDESKVVALALRDRFAGDATRLERAAESPRQVGFLFRFWADAYSHTSDERFLQAIDALVGVYESNDRGRKGDARPDRQTQGESAHDVLSLAIDCDGAARDVPEPYRTRLTSLAARCDGAFCALPHELGTKRGFVAVLRSPTGDTSPRTSHWNPADGKFTTAGVGVLCVSRYTNTGNVAYREMIVAAAGAYLDALPGDGEDAWPLTFGQAITLELAAFRITADERYHKRAFELGQRAVRHFFDESPLPRASLKSNHYESTTGGATLALALAELHLSTRTITAVRSPPNTIDR